MSIFVNSIVFPKCSMPTICEIKFESIFFIIFANKSSRNKGKGVFNKKIWKYTKKQKYAKYTKKIQKIKIYKKIKPYFFPYYYMSKKQMNMTTGEATAKSNG